MDFITSYLPKIDQATFVDVADQVSKLKMYPYFDVANCILMCLYVRDDLGTNALSFSRKHPFACWLSCMVMCFAGSLIGNLLLGEVCLTPFKSHSDVILATLVWYLMFYFPFDMFHTLVKFYPIKICIYMLKEVQRAKKVYEGVRHVYKLYPDAYLLMVIIGTIKGSGATFIRPFERLIRGFWVPTSNEVLQPTFGTKSCILASIVYILELHHIIGAPHTIVHLLVVVFFVYFRLTALLLHIIDPLLPFENLASAFLFGGIWDAVQQTISGTGGGSVGAKKGDNGPSAGSGKPEAKSPADKKKD